MVWREKRRNTAVREMDKSYDYLQGDVVNLQELSKATPEDAHKFYQMFGLLRHDRTGKVVEKLADYQYKVWNWARKYRYRLVVKSQKVGFSTSALMEDFQRAVLPPYNSLSTMGYETLVIGQSFEKAIDHLYSLQKMIKNSIEYRPFLIEKPVPGLMPTEVTKNSVLFIRNPFNPINPSRIIALGSNPGAAWSWKRVKHIHMSDPAAITAVDDSELYDAAFSRLAITRGTMLIESPPRGQRGQLWEIYKMSKLKIDIDDPQKEAREEAKFKVEEIPYDKAVTAGVMEEEFFLGERERLGPRFGQYYECEFLNPSNTWYDDSLFRFSGDIQLQ